MCFVGPSSSYSLDSDPILSILTLVASERGLGKERRGRGRKGKREKGGIVGTAQVDKLTLKLNAYY